MTRRQLSGGFVAVGAFAATLGLTWFTNGWFIVALLGFAVIAVIFWIGAVAAR